MKNEEKSLSTFMRSFNNYLIYKPKAMQQTNVQQNVYVSKT